MKKTLCVISLVLSIIGCASVPLPQEGREIKFVEETSLKQKDAYNLALGYLAKNLGDSNFAIKVKDPDSGTIITEIAFDCPELKGFMDLSRHAPVFNLEVGTKDKRVKFVFEALKDRLYNPMSGQFQLEEAFSSADKVELVKPCVQRVKAKILKQMGRKDSNW